jgi:mRNA interferase YafQ
MYQLSTTKQFEKDYKLCKKRNYKLELINEVFEHLYKNGFLPSKYKPHKLIGNYEGFWECHIRPDWLLIWLQNEDSKTIILTRTGTHADLF